jgi:predicted CopG family antitoxin
MPKTKKSRGITTIQVSIEVRDKLKELGRKGDSYDDVIRALLKRKA